MRELTILLVKLAGLTMVGLMLASFVSAKKRNEDSGVKTTGLIQVSKNKVIRSSSCGRLEDLTWLLGQWQSISAETSLTESWIKLDKGGFIGLGKTQRNNSEESPFVESLRIIEMSDDIFYLAKTPANRLPIAFKLEECSKQHLRFENLEHDFPQFIEYFMIGPNKITANVSAQNNQGFKLEFTRVVTHK